MILHTDIKRQRRQFNCFNKISVRRGAADAESGIGKQRTECIIEFIAVTMPLGDCLLPVAAAHGRIRSNDAGIAAEPERTALVNAVGLTVHEINDLMCAVGLKFAGMCIGKIRHMPRKFDHRDLHSETDAEIRNAVRSCILRRRDHALNAARAESAGNQDTVRTGEHFRCIFRCDLFRVDPADLHIRAELIARMMQRFCDRQICIMQLNIFADKRDRDASARFTDPLTERFPFAEIGRRRLQIELAADDLRKMRFFKHQRCFIEIRQREIFNDAIRLDIAEARNFRENTVIGDRLIAAQNNDIRRDAEALKLLDGMLCRLGFMLARCSEIRYERHMNIERILAPDLCPELPDCFQKRLTLDIAGCAADLGDDDIRRFLLSDAVNKMLDLIGDMRNDLHGLAEIFAAALLMQHIRIDLARRQIGKPVEVLVDEALIMPEVEVRFGAVLGDIDLAVLIGAHGTRIDIDIGIKLLRGDLEAAALEQSAERGRRNALAESRDHTAGHKNILCHNTTSEIRYLMFHFIKLRISSRRTFVYKDCRCPALQA